MRNSIITAVAILVIACGASSDTGVNKSIFVADGETRNSSLRTVNGSINVGNEATVTGDMSTVNGEISVGENSQVAELSCVNGRVSIDRNSRVEEVSCVNGPIYIGSEVEVEKELSTVNGSIKCKRGTQVGGNLETVNGEIEILETLVAGNLETVNGDILLEESSLVKGDIVIDRQKMHKSSSKRHELTITIASHSKVEGNIDVKGDDPNVTVILAGGGEVLGEIVNAKVVRK